METISEVTKRMVERRDTMDRQCYIKDDYLVLNVKYEYNIGLSRCDTAEKILGWALHLSRKNWVSMDLLERFIQVASNQIGLDLLV